MSIMLRQTADMAVQQSAQLFSQETYKQQQDQKANTANGQAKSAVFHSIQLNNEYSISGDFYGAAGVHQDMSDVKQYNRFLYGEGNAGYQAFLVGENPGNEANHYSPLQVYPALNVDVYKKNYVTPQNYGIPYVDKNFATAAFKWNTAMLFGQPSKGKSGLGPATYVVENAGQDGSGNYINYSGYRIYIDGTEITNISYYTFDTSGEGNNDLYSLKQNTATGVQQTAAMGFQDITNINPKNLTQLHSSASGYEDQMALITQTSGVSPYLRYLTVAKIDYTVKVGYSGLTPLAQAIKYINGYRVGGLDGHGATPSGNNINFDQTQQLQGTVYYWLVA